MERHHHHPDDHDEDQVRNEEEAPGDGLVASLTEDRDQPGPEGDEEGLHDKDAHGVADVARQLTEAVLVGVAEVLDDGDHQQNHREREVEKGRGAQSPDFLHGVLEHGTLGYNKYKYKNISKTQQNITVYPL